MMTRAGTEIVVVEDDPGMCQAIERVLRAAGFVASVFASGESALEACAASSTACLVLDIHLPGMSGFELYRRLMLGGNDVPVIFITAQDEPAVREEAETIGAGTYLPKPFSGRTLLDRIAQVLEPR
jgi:DNA-binding response OmpR family regulator